MKIFKKKEQVAPVDENGNPIEVKKKDKNWKGVATNILSAVGCGVLGIVVFLMVGAAMVNSDETNSGEEASDSDGSDSCTEAGEGSES